MANIGLRAKCIHWVCVWTCIVIIYVFEHACVYSASIGEHELRARNWLQRRRHMTATGSVSIALSIESLCWVQSSGAVWKSRWPWSWAVPSKLTVSVDVKQHFNHLCWYRVRSWNSMNFDLSSATYVFLSNKCTKPLPCTPSGDRTRRVTIAWRTSAWTGHINHDSYT